jgi:hypothetical protein
MNADTFLRDLVTQLAPNTTVAGIEELEGAYRVSVTGTIGVVADGELPRDEVEAAAHGGEAHRRVASALKRCADDVMGGPDMAPTPQRSERPGKAGSLLYLTGAGRASHGPPRR